MSNGNMLMGESKRKLGSIVLYVRNGQQVQRKWTDSGARRGKEASYATRAQRVQFGEAANQWDAYRYICTRMYRKGKKTTESDYNVFVRDNWKKFPYMTKNMLAYGLNTLIPGTYSRGNLGTNPMWYWYLPNEETLTTIINVGCFNAAVTGDIQWTDKLSDYKTSLKIAYPNADKVTIAMAYLHPVEYVDGNRIYNWHTISWHPVIIKLDSNNTDDDTSIAINEYFERALANTPFKGNASMQGGKILSSSTLFTWTVNQDTEGIDRYYMFATMFATNDAANDCYTTILRDNAYSKTSPAFAMYTALRTKSAFEEACDSYGYTQAVMQTDINIFGRDVVAEMYESIAEMAKVAPDDAKRLRDAVDKLGVDAFMTRDANLCKLLRAAEGSAAHRRTTTKSTKTD